MGFGDFDSICRKAPVPLCALVGPESSISGSTGIIPNCYARNIELANTIIFEGAASFLHIIALAMTVIMVLHVRSKFTAVGMLFNGLTEQSIRYDTNGKCVKVARKSPPSSTSTWRSRSAPSLSTPASSLHEAAHSRTSSQSRAG